VSTLSGTKKTEVGCLMTHKLNHLVISVCQCIVLLECVEVKLSPQVCEHDRFGCFLWLQL